MATFHHNHRLILSALIVLITVGTTSAAEPVPADKVTVYRCVDTKGKVSLQDSPCAKTSQQETREMLRPKDAPPVRKKQANPQPVIAQPLSAQNYLPLPAPPVLYQCTDYEGKVRDSEHYDPNPRCEPLWALGFREKHLPIERRGKICRWIEDSCVRYEGYALCDRWRARRKQAEADVRYAFSDTLAFRKSELARLSQIVRTSCP